MFFIVCTVVMYSTVQERKNMHMQNNAWSWTVHEQVYYFYNVNLCMYASINYYIQGYIFEKFLHNLLQRFRGNKKIWQVFPTFCNFPTNVNSFLRTHLFVPIQQKIKSLLLYTKIISYKSCGEKTIFYKISKYIPRVTWHDLNHIFLVWYPSTRPTTNNPGPNILTLNQCILFYKSNIS